MTKVTMPPETLGDPQEWEIAQGPFVMEHNGVPELGAHLEQRDDIYTVWNGGRLYEFDDSYTIRHADDVVIFSSRKYESIFVFRPLMLDDLEWAAPIGYDGAETVEEFRSDMLRMLDDGM